MSERKLSQELRAYARADDNCQGLNMDDFADWADRAAALETALAVAEQHAAEYALGMPFKRLTALEAEVAELQRQIAVANGKLANVYAQRDALAAENERLRKRPVDHEAFALGEALEENEQLRARIADAVKVLRDGDGPVEDDFEGAVREALAILEPEGEKP